MIFYMINRVGTALYAKSTTALQIFLTSLCMLLSTISLPGYDLSQFHDEHLEFDIVYRGIHAASSAIWLESADSVTTIYWIVKSRPLVDLLFKINNSYQTVIDRNGMLRKTEKIVDQKNIRQQWIINYNWREKQAISDQNYIWPVLDKSSNILAMLYDLRKKAFDPGDSLVYILDVESQLWQIAGQVQPVYDSRGHFEAHEIVFNFSPAAEMHRRTWKTDIVTSRLARPNSQLIIRLGPPPQQQPKLLQFGGDGGVVEMRLKN